MDSNLPNNWRLSNVGEFCSYYKGGVPFLKLEYSSSGIPVIAKGDIKPFGKCEHGNKRFISEKVVEEKKLYLTQPGDLIMTSRDLTMEGDVLGLVAPVPRDQKYLVNQGVNIIRLSSNINQRFFVYWTNSPMFRNCMKQSAVGSTQIHIRKDDFLNAPIIVPPLKEQDIIAQLLGNLDDKIENLRKQNQTLEKIAQTLFKHWFIDFEFPNENGDPYHSSGGAMKPSELGEIPEGWRVGKLGDIISLIIDYRGKTPKKLGSDWSFEGIPALSAKNIKNGEIVRQDAINFASKDLYHKWMKEELQQGDILLTSEAPLGEVYYLAKNQKYVLSQRLVSLRAKSEFSSPYLYFWLKSFQGQYLLNRRATGSTVQGIRQVELRKVEIIIPSPEILKTATDLWSSTLHKMDRNYEQVQTLTKIRDTLLPKLMSGKLRIKDETIT